MQHFFNMTFINICLYMSNSDGKIHEDILCSFHHDVCSKLCKLLQKVKHSRIWSDRHGYITWAAYYTAKYYFCSKLGNNYKQISII